ncbi:MAG: AMP-binding protein [Candidatus Rokubacteria bacterium]|nr:AMP-binding protein [Candidatus Rokubacteria bacterium]
MELGQARTIPDILAIRARREPSGFYFDLYDEPMTYGALWALSRRYAAGLARAGVERGDHVAIVLPTCKEFFATFFGVMALGAVPVPLYPTFGPAELASIFGHAEPRAAVTISWFEAAVRQAQASAPSLTRILEPDELDRPAEEPPWPSLTGDETAFLQYTSGSTGHPKGVDLPHRSLLANIRAFVEAVQVRPGEPVVSWLPLYHDMGLIGLGLGTLYAGCPLHLLAPDLRNPRQWLELVTRTRATITASPDFGYRNCLRNVHDVSGLDLTSLRIAFTGAEPIRPDTVARFEERFGLKDVLVPAYGLAEATLAVALGDLGAPIRVDRSGRFVGVGRPIPGVEVGIWEETGNGRGRRLPAGEAGEIVVQTPAAMRGYYRDPAATTQAFRSGWLHTGDLGYLEPDGYLFVVGRQKDLIVVRGENVMPLDVEAVVDAVPGVRYSAAVGLGSDRLGTQRLVVVAEVRNPAAPPAEASALVRGIVRAVHRIRGFRPSRVLLVRPGAIPKTTSGKIQHGRLAAVVADDELGESLLYPRRGGARGGTESDADG